MFGPDPLSPKKIMPFKALITGATGFIGSHLVEALKERNWKVICLVRATSKTDFLQRLSVPFVVGHAKDLRSLERAVEGQDYVFHLAGQIRPVSQEIYDLANHQFTRNLVQACLNKNPGLKRFVYVSSISAAGPSPPGLYSDESQPCAPNSEYGRSKLKGEEAVKEFWHSISATIIRPPNVYGPRQQEIELLISLISNRIVPLLREGGETTSLIYINDLVEGIIQIALSPKTKGQIYYLTEKNGYSWRKIIFVTKKYLLGNSFFLPLPESLIYFSAWLSDLLRKIGIVKLPFGRKVWTAMVKTPWLFSSAKAEKDLGFRTKYNFKDGIRATLSYYNK